MFNERLNFVKAYKNHKQKHHYKKMVLFLYSVILTKSFLLLQNLPIGGLYQIHERLIHI